MKFDLIEALIGDLDGDAAIVIQDLSTQATYVYNETKRFPSASLIKLPILLELFDRHAEKSICMNDIVTVKEEDIVEGYGIIKDLHRGISLSLFDYAYLMITLSDNVATNQLIQILGMDHINCKIDAIGCQNTILQRKMMDFGAKAKGLDNYTSALDLKKIFEYIYYNEKYKPAMEILKKQLCNNLLPALIEEDIVFAHKTGDLQGLRHDAGIMFLRNPVLVIVLTNNLNNDRDGTKFLNEVGRIIYKRFR